MVAAAATKRIGRPDASAMPLRLSSAPGSTAIRTEATPSTPDIASSTWASSGRPPIGTSPLWVTPASAASGSSLPSRWAARTTTVKGPLAGIVEQSVAAKAFVEDGFDQLGLAQTGAHG